MARRSWQFLVGIKYFFIIIPYKGKECVTLSEKLFQYLETNVSFHKLVKNYILL